MMLANPAGLLLLLLLPLVILFHLRRPIRRKIAVSTVKFWSGAPTKPTNTYSFTRRLFYSPSLLLQLLAVTLAALALANPSLTLTEKGRSRTVLIIDNSASTLAPEGEKTRFALIRGEAERRIAELHSGQKAMIIAAGIRAEVVAPFTDDRVALRQALDRITPPGGAADIAGAINLATQLLDGEPPGNIHLFVDTNVTAAALGDTELPLNWHVIGSPRSNVGITAFDVRTNPQQQSAYEAFVALTNAGDGQSQFKLRLSIDGRKFYETDVELEAHARRSYVIPFSENAGGILKAEIDIQDGFTVDNAVHAVIPAPKTKKVLLVSDGNFFLETALRTHPDLDVQSITPGLIKSASLDADVVILDRISEEDLGRAELPPGNYLLIQTLPKNVPIKSAGALEDVATLITHASTPIGRHLDMTNVFIRRAMKIETTGDCTNAVEAAQSALVVGCESHIGRLVFVGFDLLQSELPLRVGLPILLNNALGWLSPSGLEGIGAFASPGERIATSFNRTASAALVTRPDGETTSVALTDGRFAYDATDMPGIYSVVAGEQRASFAINMLDENETNLATTFEAPIAGSSNVESTFTYEFQIWPLLALLVIALIAAEFFYFLSVEGRPLPIFASLFVVLTLASLAAALIKPSIQVLKTAGSVAFLVDVSDSISTEKKKQIIDATIAARNAKGADDNFEIITFAGRAGPLNGPSTESPASGFDARTPEQTDIANAVRVALGKMPTGDTRKLVVISDGNETTGDASRAAHRANLQGVEISPILVSDANDGEVIVESVLVPDTVRRGEAFNVQITVWAGKPQAATLSLSRDAEPLHSQQVNLLAGKNVFRIKESSVEERVHRYTATITAPDDRNGDNNSADAAVGVRGEARVLIVTSDPSRVSNLADALKTQNFSVDTIHGAETSEHLRNLDRYDTVIIDNVPAANLTESGMTAIQRYVAEDGGGLIMVGGDQSFGLGGYEGTPIEDVLPVSMMPRAKIEVPSQAIVLVIDRSGSMSTAQSQRSRIDLAKQAAQESVAMLADNTQVGVLTFDTEADWIVPIKPAEDKEAIQRDISTIDTGGGGTELLTALEEAHRGLQGKSASLKHIVVLSDGEAPEKHFKELLAKIEADKITVSTIAISSEAGQDLLKKIADWGGGRYYFTDNLYALPRILTTETRLVSDKGLAEDSFRPSVVRNANEVLKRLDWSSAPSLKGFVKTTLKPLSEPLLISPAQDPVLALGHSGIGRTAAFTSDFSGKWGKEWLAWPDFPRFIGQLVRWTNRAPLANLQPSLSVTGSDGKLTLEAIDRRGNFMNFLDGEVGIIYPDQSRKVFNLRQTGPGRYESTFPAEMHGLYLAGVSIAGSNDPEIKTAFTEVSVPKSAEHRAFAANTSLMQRIADTTAGRILQSPGEIFPLGTKSIRQLPIWPYLILLAFAFFMLQLLARWFASRAKAARYRET